MPYKTTWEKHGAFTKWWGHCSVSELVEFIQRSQGTPNFDDARYSIHDFSECEGLSSNDKEVQFAAVLDKVGSITNPNIRIAVITDRSDVIEGINAYKKTMLSNYPVQIFSSVADARNWVK